MKFEKQLGRIGVEMAKINSDERVIEYEKYLKAVQ